MDEGSPYFISKNKHKKNTKNKKDFDPDSKEEDEENENESLSEIKNVSSKKRTKNLISDESEDKFSSKEVFPSNKNNFQKEIKQYDDSKNESVNINITKIKPNNNDKDKNTDKDKYNIDDLLKQLKEKENEINEKNNIINNLKKEINEKENKIKLITKTNNKLKLSLDEFSKKVDEKLFNNKNIFNNFRKSKYSTKNNNNDDEVKQKELDNLMNIIKILKNDNQRLQDSIDNYEKNTKLKDLENINKIKEDENINLENQIKLLKKELNNYNLCLKKCKIYENQIEILNKENKSYKDNNKMLKNKLSRQIQKSNSTMDLNENNRNKGYLSPKRIDNFRNVSYVKKSRNMYDSNSDRYKINLNDKYNSLNNKEGYLKINNRISSLHQSMGSLPTIKNKINYKNTNTPVGGLSSYKKNYENMNDILKTFFNQDDIELINKIFKSNIKGFEAFKLKLCIINKSKETLNNKFNLEIKKYNERIISAQEQIEYLNSKIRESEVNYRVLQTQMNEFNIQKKLLLKKIKKLEENLIEKDNILKLNFAGEDINNKNVEIEQNLNVTNKNSEDGSSKIAREEDSNSNNSRSSKDDNKSENSQSSIEKK